MTIKTFEEIVSWQKAKELHVLLYEELKSCPDRSYKDQILRANLSISNNIAEGFDRSTIKDFRHYLVIARGSAAEVRSMILVGSEIGLIKTSSQDRFINLIKSVSELLSAFIRALDLQKMDNGKRPTYVV